jgi:hypothetical protein
MRALGIMAVALALAACSGGGDNATADSGAAKVDNAAAAKAEVARFRELMDAGNGAEIYKNGLEAMKAAVPEKTFVDTINGLHGKLGNFKMAGDPVVKEDTGDAGPQITLTYDPSIFDNGSMRETFTYVLVDGKPQLGAYDYKVAEAPPVGEAPAEEGAAEEKAE